MLSFFTMIFSSRQLKHVVVRNVLLMLFCCSIVSVTGCGGCSDKDAKAKADAKKKKEEEEKKKKKKKKKPFEKQPAVFLPGERQNPLSANRYKAGHWVNVQVPTVSNRNNYDGILQATPIRGTRPMLLEGSNFYMTTSRPVSLPKEQWKNLETTVFIPRREGDGSMISRSVTVDFRLRSRSGTGDFGEPSGSILLKEYQYHFGVLTSNPARYSYLKIIDTTKLPNNESSTTRPEIFYHLFYSQKDQQVPLPSQSLAWTTIAYLLWDDLDPDLLTPEQQTAMVDWLHWGGQLIISGPASLEKLSTSFLADYLPATVAENVNLTASDFAELNQSWSIPVRNKRGEKHNLQIPADAKLLGCKLEPTDSSTIVASTGGLVAERNIGRGRIVATAFALDSRVFLRWRSFAGFYQTCLMRRPARLFHQNSNQVRTYMTWEASGPILDPLLGSTLRYLSRDLGPDGTAPKYVWQPPIDPDVDRRFGFSNTYIEDEPQIHTASSRVLTNKRAYGGYTNTSESGVAGWNDHSAVSEASREILGSAAGITPPSRDFVLRMLLIYLAALVPANWLIFKLIGRVEWAWMMAPIISIVGAVAVVKFAALDIGFVRSSTTVSVLELHGGYSRGHLTSYTSLYTSLSTNYDVEFSDSEALIMPFSKSIDYQRPVDASPKKVQLDIGRDIRFQDFPIQSNTSERYHSERMLDIGGNISLIKNNGKLGLQNSSNLELLDAAVIQLDAANQFQVAWLGEVKSGQQIDALPFKQNKREGLRGTWSQSRVMFSPVRCADQIIEIVKNNRETKLFTSEIPYLEITQAIEQDSKLNELMKNFAIATQRCSTLRAAELRDLDNLVISRDQLIEICELANESDRFRLGRLLDLFVDKLEFQKGEMRLIAWTSQKVDQATIKPDATQTTQKTMIIVHLERPALSTPKRESRVFSDYSKFDYDDYFKDDEEKDDGGSANGENAIN